MFTTFACRGIVSPLSGVATVRRGIEFGPDKGRQALHFMLDQYHLHPSFFRASFPQPTFKTGGIKAKCRIYLLSFHLIITKPSMTSDRGMMFECSIMSRKPNTMCQGVNRSLVRYNFALLNAVFDRYPQEFSNTASSAASPTTPGAPCVSGTDTCAPGEVVEPLGTHPGRSQGRRREYKKIVMISRFWRHL